MRDFAGAIRLAEHVLEDRHALVAIGHALAQARLHHLVPDRRVVPVLETFRLVDGVLHRALELGFALRVRGRAPRSPAQGSRTASEGQEYAHAPRPVVRPPRACRG